MRHGYPPGHKKADISKCNKDDNRPWRILHGVLPSKARSPRPPKFLLHRHASLHAPDVLLVQVLIEAGVEVRPPLKQHRLANKLEPGRELEARVFEELLKLIGRNVLGVANLVEVGVKIDIGLDEKDVIDCIR